RTISAASAAPGRLDEVAADLVREADLAVIGRRIADDPAGVHYAPDRAGVARGAIEDLERDPMGVLDRGRVDRFHDQLGQVAGAEVGGEIAPVVDGFAGRSRAVRKEGPGRDLARRPDADVHVLDAVTEPAAGMREAEAFVGSLGPA